MRVLVTGGAGYIGSHTCKELHKAGCEPIVYDNLSTGHDFAVRWGVLERGDLQDTVRLIEIMQLYRPEGVIHFAARAYVGESISHPNVYYSTNVEGTLSLLNAMRISGVNHLVLSSTCATYGLPRALPIPESAPQEPINPYGRSKLMVERIVSDYVQAYQLGAIALRYFNAAGASPDGELGEEHDPETHLIPLVLQVAAGDRDAVTIFGQDYPTEDGTCIRDYVHVSDLATAHITALRQCVNGRFSAFNLGTGTGWSVRQIIDRAEQLTGRPIEWRAAHRRPGDPPELVADPTLAARELAWSPKHSGLDTIIGTSWAWLSQYRYCSSPFAEALNVRHREIRKVAPQGLD